MHPDLLATAPRSTHHGARPLLVLAALLALGLLLHGPIPQWASYHQFADQRGWHGLPHAADVLSNLPFALIGLWALWARREEPRRKEPERPASEPFHVRDLLSIRLSKFAPSFYQEATNVQNVTGMCFLSPPMYRMSWEASPSWIRACIA